MVFNQQVDGGCSKRRPDVRIEYGTHSIIIECDENQHKNISCEEKRTMELFQDLGSRPLVVIRFNPDTYGIIEVCFKSTKSGMSLNKKECEIRICVLVKLIEQYIKNILTKEVTVDKLFYD